MQRAVLSFSIALGTACADNATPSDGGTPLITGQVDVTLSGYTACDQYGAKTASLGLTNPDSADYTGLECVLWTQTSGGMLWLDLVNVPAACDYSSTRPDAWRASAEITATGTLRVSLARDAADASSCTGCLHDFPSISRR